MFRPRVVLAFLALSSFVVLVALASIAMAENISWGDTTVTGEESYSDINLTLTGNLTVAGDGSLELNDTVIVVNATRASQFTILVEEDGALQLHNVTIGSAGGTYRIEVRGWMDWNGGSAEDLEAEYHIPTVPRGLVVFGQGFLNLADVEVVNPAGYAIYVNDTGVVSVARGRLYGASTAVRVNTEGTVSLVATELGADTGTDLVVLMGSSVMYAEDTRFDSDDVYSSSIHDVAVTILGEEAGAVLWNCTIATTELATMNGGYLEITGSTFEPDRLRGIPDLNARNADVVIEDIDLREVVLSGCTVELWESTYSTGTVSNASTLLTYGPVPPLSTLSADTAVHHHYWVDFLLLNVSGDPEEGVDLSVINSLGGLVLNEALSDEEGMVRGVPVRSWTLLGDRLEYEPSHRVEFAGPSYQITNLQVFDNTTVTLWDRVGSFDLVLNTDSVTPSIPAPEENRTFDLIVDGQVLVPYPWATGNAQAALYVDGALFQTRDLPLTSRDDVLFVGLDLEAGTHEFRVVLDRGNDVAEMNEGGNNEVRLLLDVAPEGGTGELVDLTVEITRVGDTAGESGEELVSGIIYVDYTVTAYNSRVLMRNVPVAFYVDEAMDDVVRVDLVDTDGEVFTFNGQFRVNLPRGDYVLRVVVDPFDEIEEEREYNNEDQRTVTLSDDPGDEPFFDEACCISILIFTLITAVGLLGTWAQRRQRMAAEQAGAAGYSGPPVSQPSMAGGQAYGAEPRYPTQVTTVATEPRSLDERWRVEQSTGAYTADGWEDGVAERITGGTKRTPPSRERYKASDLTCPRCRGRDIMGFSDGSAKCQSCKKIFYPGRRY